MPTGPPIATTANTLPPAVSGLNGYHDIRFRPGAETQVAGFQGDGVLVWDFVAAAPVARLTGSPGEIEDIAFSPHGT